jgi:hypothetical protein
MDFFVRDVGKIPSPCCGKSMSVIGTGNRKSKESSGETKVYNIWRLRYNYCCRDHHELPPSGEAKISAGFPFLSVKNIDRLWKKDSVNF